MSKEFVDARNLLRDSFSLARRVFDSGFLPDVLLVLWRGGTPIGIAVHEYLLYKGVDTYHTVVKAESYRGIEDRMEPRIEGLDAVVQRISVGARVLIIDDIFDSGCTVRKVRSLLQPKTDQVRIATLYYKPFNNQTDLVPDYYIRETDKWIVFPHELVGLTSDEIGQKGLGLEDLT